MNGTPEEPSDRAARLERQWRDVDPRDYREAYLVQALLEAYKEIVELRKRVRDSEIADQGGEVVR
jgi:hypothetical protein